MTQPPRRPLPVIPILVFAGIDLLLALLLLIQGGFTLGFMLIALVGIALALFGWIALKSLPERE